MISATAGSSHCSSKRVVAALSHSPRHVQDGCGSFDFICDCRSIVTPTYDQVSVYGVGCPNVGSFPKRNWNGIGLRLAHAFSSCFASGKAM